LGFLVLRAPLEFPFLGRRDPKDPKVPLDPKDPKVFRVPRVYQDLMGT